MGGYGVARSGNLLAQGELAVGAAHVTLGSGTGGLGATSYPCAFVWVGAPTSSHTVGAANDGTILVGADDTSNASGGRPLTPTDTAGFIIPIADAAALTFTGFAAGDVVEYQVLGG